MSDAEAVAADKESLTTISITFSGSDTADNVTGDLILPTAGESGTTISWNSDDTEVISNTGEVTRPSNSQGDVTVTLTATISKGGESDTL